LLIEFVRLGLHALAVSAVLQAKKGDG
jgi:hypothetical protein